MYKGFLLSSYLAFANMSAILGFSETAAEYTALAQTVADAMNTNFLDWSTGV